MPQELPQPAIYSQNLKTKGKTYFFDIKHAKSGNKYLAISESWIAKDGQRKRGTITVFADQLANFRKTIEQVAAKAA